MESSYKRIGDYIAVLDVRNTDGALSNLTGISITKNYIPSVANIQGTDLTKYKVISKGQFSCSLMQVSRDGRIPIAMYTDETPAIMSPAYVLFEVIKTDEILPEYLELWFKRAEFDREACFLAVGGVRGSLEWEDFCNMKLPVPSIEEQRKIVRDYKVVTDRIELLKKINENLEAQAQTIYQECVKDNTELESVYEIATIINGSPFSSESFNPDGRGYPLVRIRDLTDCNPDVFTDEILAKMEYVLPGDVLIGMDGEFIPHIWHGRKGVLNQRVCKAVPAKPHISPLFVYLTLKPILAEIQRTQGGTTVIHVGKKDFDNMSVIKCSVNEHEHISEVLDPIFKLMTANYQEVNSLNILAFEMLSLTSKQEV